MSALHVQRRKGEGPPAILFTSVVGRGRRKVPLRALGAIQDDKTFWGGRGGNPLGHETRQIGEPTTAASSTRASGWCEPPPGSGFPPKVAPDKSK